MSLDIVIGLHEMYNSLKFFSFLRLERKAVTFLCNPSLGGSTITSQILARREDNSGLFISIFSADQARNITD